MSTRVKFKVRCTACHIYVIIMRYQDLDTHPYKNGEKLFPCPGCNAELNINVKDLNVIVTEPPHPHLMGPKG